MVKESDGFGVIVEIEGKADRDGDGRVQTRGSTKTVKGGQIGRC